MVFRKTTLSLALVASLAIAAPASASNTEHPDVAHAAGGDVPPLTPSIVGVPILRTEKALTKAANYVDDSEGAKAGRQLTASRKYLIRSYKGAKKLIATVPPPDAEEASASSQRFRTLARRWIRASRKGSKARRRWIRKYVGTTAKASQFAPPVFADAPTAVFSVFASQYQAATTSASMIPDTKGTLLDKVKNSLYTSIILRNRLVKIIAAAAPPPPADEARAAQDEDDATTFDVVMPGLVVLLDDEIQLLQSEVDDPSTPATSQAAIQKAIAADNKIKAQVNALWPPVVDD